jgi:ATP-dependent Lon protease
MPDIPQEVRDTLKFHFVSNTDEVLAIALGEAKPSEKPAKTPKVRKPVKTS